MKKCITELIKSIKSIQNELLLYKSDLREHSCVSYLSNEKPIYQEFDLNYKLHTINKLNTQIRKLKACIQKSNNETIVYETMNMVESLIYLAELNDTKSLLTELIYKTELSRRNIQGTVEYTKTLYKISDAKLQLDEITNLINQVQMAIDRSNLTTEIDI